MKELNQAPKNGNRMKDEKREISEPRKPYHFPVEYITLKDLAAQYPQLTKEQLKELGL